ncbi:MAG: carbohydrate kinase family protein [Bacillota bacterium]
MYDVVGIDAPNIDLLLNLEEFPKPDGFTPVSACSWQGGGKVATGMVAAARLGAKAAMLGFVGDDAYGRFILEDFERHGIDIGGIAVRKGKRTNMATVLSDRQSGGRSVLWLPGDAERLRSDEIPDHYLQNTRFFHIAQADELTLDKARKARLAGAKVIIDADNYSDDLLNCFDAVDIFIASEFVYNKMFSGVDYEAASRAVLQKGPEIAVFTLGSRGCAGTGPEGFFFIPAYSVQVKDTVGAGDVFHGAFVAGLLRGWNAEQTARFASAVSAIKCTRIGGRAGIPTMDAALAFMQTGTIDESELDERVEYYSKGIV